MSVNNRLTSAGFGTITEAADPRIVQLGLRFFWLMSQSR
jgi:hypothetical protein